MKRKILLPIIICLAVVGSVAAATSYTARVDVEADPTVGHTKNAELAIYYDKSDPIAEDVLNYTGSPKVVEVKLKKVQRNSEYIYRRVLKITNNKLYDIWLRCENVSSNLGDWEADFNFTMVGHSTAAPGDQCLWTDGHGGDSTSPPAWGVIKIPAGATAYVSFEVETGNAPDHTSYTGTITFKGYTPGP